MKVYCAHTDLVEIEKLVPHPKNPNQHPPEQIEMLAKIMRLNGVRRPITVSNRSGFMTVGHARLEAAIKNNWTHFPVDRQEYATEADEYADMVADNKIAELAESSDEIIQELALQCGPDFDFDRFGIPDFKIAALRENEPQCDEDEIPESAPARTQPGDIYQLGTHRLMCGDSTSIDAVERLMASERVDMVFTDPPYGMAYQSNAWDSKARYAQIKKTSREIEGDESTDTGAQAIALIPSVVKPKAHIFIWCRWDSFEAFRQAVAPLAEVKGNIVWDKGDSPGLGDLECSFGGNELAVHAVIGRRKIRSRINSVWRVNRPKGLSMVHPTQKPIEIVEPALENCTEANDSVLDLFGGSGSTLIACEKTNRRCFMMELDPHYCDVIVTRWEKYTGQKAELLSRACEEVA